MRPQENIIIPIIILYSVVVVSLIITTFYLKL